MGSVFDDIIKWNKERKIPQDFNMDAEVSKLAEELQELEDSTSAVDATDALCDLIVVATGGLWKLEANPNCAMKETLKEINSRSGSFNVESGKWEKEITGEEYAANYLDCAVMTEGNE